MGNNQDKDKKFFEDSKNFYNQYYSKKIPNQLKAMLDQFDVFRNEAGYGTCIRPHQQYRAHKNNKGIIYCTNQTFYYGDLVDKEAEGQGILFYHNFIYYKGQFKHGVPEGQGNLISCAGNITILLQKGTWQKGKFIRGKIHPLHNSGIKTIQQTNTNQFYIEFQDKSSYRGQGYIQDQHFYMHGIGNFQIHNKKYKYNGNWVKNVREGLCQLQNGDNIFKGICKEGQKSSGTLINNQFKYQGKWENDKIFTGKATHLRSGKVQQFISNKKQRLQGS